MNAHYEIWREGTGSVIAKTGSNTEQEFNWMCSRAQQLSGDGCRYEIRYRGWSERARNLLIAAYQDGEALDIRTTQGNRGASVTMNWGAPAYFTGEAES